MGTHKLIKGVMALAAVALTFGACNRSTVFTQYKPTPLAGWEKNDTLIYELQTVKSGMDVEEIVGIRVNDAYPFKALCLIIDQIVLPRNLTLSDTVNCRLFDDDGNTLGGGVSSYQYTFPFATQRLEEGDSLVIKIRHNMKREIVPGISDVGILLKKGNMSGSH